MAKEAWRDVILKGPGPQTKKEAIALYVKGLLMGTADLVPGVSGGRDTAQRAAVGVAIFFYSAHESAIWLGDQIERCIATVVANGRALGRRHVAAKCTRDATVGRAQCVARL